jgi:hypothetical protein
MYVLVGAAARCCAASPLVDATQVYLVLPLSTQWYAHMHGR